MNQKIEWYREVLELEPGSRVFFPLARLEAEDGQLDAAISTLRRGVARHPDHIEARLFLVDLLFKVGDQAELGREIDHVSSILGSYPGFMAAWSDRLSADKNMPDAGLALRFLSSSLNGNNISWAEVISKGLTQVLSAGAMPEAQPLSAADEPFVSQEAVFAPAEAPLQPEGPLGASSPGEASNDPEDEENEEPFSLRTRSMAELLLEQGDYNGAREIYGELLAGSADEAEQAELSDKLNEIGRLAAAPPEAPVTEQPDDLRGVAGKNRLLDALETLAQRLEARA